MSLCSGRWLRLVCMLCVAAIAIAPRPSLADAFPILLYHRFAAQAVDSMTVRSADFETQLRQLEAHGYRVVPLRQFVDHLVNHAPPPPARSVAITVDDGHRSVYTELFPIVLRHRIPVTLFIYPSAISHASYALTWEQLRELRASGWFDIESHSYWHPNFMREKRRLDAVAYRRFVDMQLLKSKQALDARLGLQVDLLAWPFGLYDDELEAHAREAGYVAAFTMERKPATDAAQPMEIPRYLITAAVSARAFDAILEAAAKDGSKR